MKGYDEGIALDFFNAMPGDTVGSAEYEHNHVKVLIADTPDRLSVTTECSHDHPWSEVLFAITRDFLELYFSETTNSDACEITITEKSGHFVDDPQDRVVVRAELLDYLS